MLLSNSGIFGETMKGILCLVALLAVSTASLSMNSSAMVVSDTRVRTAGGNCSECTWGILFDVDEPEDPVFTLVFERCNEVPGEFPYPVPAGTRTEHWQVNWSAQNEVEHQCQTLDIIWDDLLDPPNIRDIVASWPAHWEMVPAWSCYAQSVKWLRKTRMQIWEATVSGVPIYPNITRSGGYVYDWEMVEETTPMVLGVGGVG